MKNKLLIPIFLLFCITNVSAQGDQAPWPDYNQYFIGSTSCEIHGVFDPSTAIPVTLTVSHQLLPAGNWIQDTVFTINQITFSFLIDGLDPDSDYLVHIDCINSVGSYLWTMSFSTDPVGVDEAEKNAFNLFPNPMTSDLFIENAEVNDLIIISDMIGKQVHSEKIHDNKQQKIVVGELPAGIYFVTVGEKTTRVQKK